MAFWLGERLSRQRSLKSLCYGLVSWAPICLEAHGSASLRLERREALGLWVLTGRNKNAYVPNPDERHGDHDQLNEAIGDDERGA